MASLSISHRWAPILGISAFLGSIFQQYSSYPIENIPQSTMILLKIWLIMSDFTTRVSTCKWVNTHLKMVWCRWHQSICRCSVDLDFCSFFSEYLPTIQRVLLCQVERGGSANKPRDRTLTLRPLWVTGSIFVENKVCASMAESSTTLWQILYYTLAQLSTGQLIICNYIHIPCYTDWKTVTVFSNDDVFGNITEKLFLKHFHW